MEKKYEMARLVTVGLWLSASIALSHNPAGKPDAMNAALEKLKGAEFEQSFLQQMIQHHRAGIDMAKLASDHTQRTELRQFADKTMSNQQQEVEKMTGWLKSWYNVASKVVANEAADREMKTHMSLQPRVAHWKRLDQHRLTRADETRASPPINAQLLTRLAQFGVSFELKLRV